MDRSSKQKMNKETQVLNDTLGEMDLIDIFRTFHPNAEEYTFFLFWVLVLEGLRSLHRTVQLQLLQHFWLRHRLGLLDTEWLALEMNRNHSVIFEISSKYSISDSFVDHDGYSISSEGFLPAVVDIQCQTLFGGLQNHCSHEI